MVRIATTDGTHVYGPFSVVLHATAWFHDLISRLQLTNVHGASAYPVNAPFDVLAAFVFPPVHAKRPAGPAPEPPPQRPHVVIVGWTPGSAAAPSPAAICETVRSRAEPPTAQNGLF